MAIMTRNHVLPVVFLVVMGSLLAIAVVGSQQQQEYRSRAYSSPPTPTSVPVTSTPTPRSCPMKTVGDANCDGHVDGIDYSIWLNSQCNPGTGQVCADTRADFNGDGKVNDDDYQIWFAHRGT